MKWIILAIAIVSPLLAAETSEISVAVEQPNMADVRRLDLLLRAYDSLSARADAPAWRPYDGSACSIAVNPKAFSMVIKLSKRYEANELKRISDDLSKKMGDVVTRSIADMTAELLKKVDAAKSALSNEKDRNRWLILESRLRALMPPHDVEPRSPFPIKITVN